VIRYEQQANLVTFFKAADLHAQNAQKIKHEKEITVHTGQYKLKRYHMSCSVEKSIITDPLIQVKKLTTSLVKHRFPLHNLLRH